jgi:hypothetical protein
MKNRKMRLVEPIPGMLEGDEFNYCKNFVNVTVYLQLNNNMIIKKEI